MNEVENDLSHLIATQMLETIKKDSEEKTIEQSVKNAINLCIGNVVFASINDDIRKKVDGYIKKNISKIVNKALVQYIKSSQHDLEAKIHEAFLNCYREEAEKFVKNFVKFEVNVNSECNEKEDG